MLAQQAPAEPEASLASGLCSACNFSPTRPLQHGWLLWYQLLRYEWLLQHPTSPVHTASPAPRSTRTDCFSSTQPLQSLDDSGDRLLKHKQLVRCQGQPSGISTWRPGAAPAVPRRRFCSGVPPVRHIPVNSFPHAPEGRCPANSRSEFPESSTIMAPQWLPCHALSSKVWISAVGWEGKQGSLGSLSVLGVVIASYICCFCILKNFHLLFY